MDAPFVREHVFSVPSLLHSLEVVENFRVELSPVDVCRHGEFNSGCGVIVNVVGGVDMCSLVKIFGGYNCDCDSDFAEVVCEGAGHVRETFASYIDVIL